MRRSSLVALMVACFTMPMATQAQGREAFLALPAPLFTLDSGDDPELEYSAISAVRRLPSGEMVVADARSPVIRIFSPDGQRLRTVGREGGGPGEFRNVQNVFLAGDTLFVYDWHQRRLTRLNAGGTVFGTQQVRPAAELAVDLVARLRDGRWLVTSTHMPSWTQGHGMYRDTLRVGILASGTAGRVRWVPASYPGMSLFAYMPSDDRSQWWVGPLMLAATTIVRAGGDTLYVGDTATPYLDRWRPDGQRLPRLALPLPPAPDLQLLRDAERDEALARPGADEERGQILAMHGVARVQPRYRDFLVAASGDLWVRLYGRTPADSTRYLVLSPDATVRAQLALPPRSRVLAVDAPLVFVETLDGDDVPTVGVVRWVPR